MAVIFEISTEHNNYEGITVYDRFSNGVAAGWEVRANEGFVFYDTRRNDTEIDPETMEEIPVTYYYTIKSIPRTYNDWDNFPYVAVPRDSVDENYIFGGGNEPDHEIMSGN